MDLALSCSALPGQPLVIGFRGEEALGQCFEYDVYVSLDDADLQPATVVGAAATLEIPGGATPARIAGAIAEIELLEGYEGLARSAYRLRLVPALWFLRHSVHSRVFVQKSTPDILRAVLTGAGVQEDQFELRLGTTYDPRDHVCQYEESDLAFVERWMEREGLYYFFDHAAGTSKLVICDSRDQHATMRQQPVAYLPGTRDDRLQGERLWTLRASFGALPKDVGVSDYNYSTPGVTIDATAPVVDGFDAQVRRWGENERDGGGATRVAKLRAEQELCRRERILAEGAASGLHAGFTFSVSEHPAAAYNRELLVVRVVRWGQTSEVTARLAPLLAPEERARIGDRSHGVELEAIASDVQFRSPQRTPRPVARGLELAVIDGPADSDYAQLDDQGRYLVRFMFDENDAPDGGASTLVRHVQPHGGSPEGWHLPLRKGTEVLVAFVGGDPDRPVIAGSVPNAQNPSPVTKANHTRNVLQTGGRTRIEIEDQDGTQYVDISTPPETTYLHLGAHAGLGDHNVAISTAGDGLIHTTGKRDITVGGNQTEDVKGNLTETYHGNQTTHVASAFTETIDSGATQTIHSGFQQTITGGSKQSIDSGETRTVSGGVTETINGARVQLIVGSSTESVSGAQTQTITGGAAINATGTYTVKADGGITLSTGGPMTMMCNTFLMNAAGGQTNVDWKFGQYYGVQINAFVLVWTSSAINVQAIRTQMGGYLARFDVFARKREVNGILIQNKGTSLHIGAMEKVTAAIKAMFGFKVVV